MNQRTDFGNAEFQVEKIREIITRIRNLKSNYNIQTNKNIKVAIISNKEWIKYFDRHIMKLAGTRQPEYLPENSSKPANSVTSVVSGIGIICLNLGGMVDFKKERERLNKEASALQKFISSLEKRLSDQQFTGKAPENIINQQKESLKKSKSKLQEIKNILKI